ncbi:hypothetical protein ACIRBX_00010 [Kitasatospora sp. NPDC096147]|uniref:hypothetical protein n=1 Tax=Kitasatospora sp. NPDC096147 TaxID=3364093 RepID=UPI003808675A
MSDFDGLFERVRAQRREAEARGPEPEPVVPLTAEEARHELMKALGSWALGRYLEAGIAPTFPAGRAGLWSPRRALPRPAPEPRRWWQRRPPVPPVEYERGPDLWEILSYEHVEIRQGEYVRGDVGMYGSGSSGYHETYSTVCTAYICVDREATLICVKNGVCRLATDDMRHFNGFMIPGGTMEIDVMKRASGIEEDPGRGSIYCGALDSPGGESN